MPSNTKLRLFCYDIECNKRRRKVSKLLEQEGTRVQLSVFETRLTDHAAEILARKIDDLLINHDSLRVYTVGRAAERRCQVYGSGTPIEVEASYWLF